MIHNRIHPIHALRWFGLFLGITSWGLITTGYITGNNYYSHCAMYLFGLLLIVAFAPLIIFIFTSFFKKK